MTRQVNIASRTRWRPAVRLVALLGFVLVWQLLTAPVESRPTPPVPTRVWSIGLELVRSGELQQALLISLRRVALGFGAAFAIGIPLGLAMGFGRLIEQTLNPLVQAFRSIAPIAVLPLFLLWLGQGDAAASAVVAYAALFPIIINTIAGVKDVDLVYIRAGRTLGLSRFAMIRTVILPAAVPNIVVGARLAMGLAWGSIVAAELAVGAKTGASGGIGQMMFIAYAYRIDLDTIVVFMVAVGVFGFVIDQGIRLLYRRAMPWSV